MQKRLKATRPGLWSREGASFSFACRGLGAQQHPVHSSCRHMAVITCTRHTSALPRTAHFTEGLHTKPQPPLWLEQDRTAHTASKGALARRRFPWHSCSGTGPRHPKEPGWGKPLPLCSAAAARLESRTQPSRCVSQRQRTQSHGAVATQTSRDAATANATFLQLNLPAVSSPQPGREAERV